MTAAASVSPWRHRMALVAVAVIVIAVGGFVLAQISRTPGEPRVSCIGVDPAECDRLWRDMLADTGEESTDGLGRNRVVVTKQPGPCDTEMIEVVFTDGTAISRNPGLC